MARIKAILFDLDDTLYDCSGSLVDAARRRAAKAMVAAGLPCSEEEAYRLQADLTARHGPSYRVFDHIAERYGKGRDFVESVFHAYNRSEVEDIRPFPDVISVLRNLRAQGYLLFLVTSGVHRRQEQKIKLLGIAPLFDEVVINDSEIGTGLEENYIALMTRHGLTPQECMVVGDRVDAEIRVANYLRITTVQIMHGRFKSLQPKSQFEQPDFRISRLTDLHDVLAAANKRRHREQARILAIGGGTGLPMVLQGLKAFSRNLTAIVTVTDSGRSSGKLRRDLGVLPPGDARNCLIALSSSDKTGRQLHDLFQYRFEEGGLAGMSFGNLFLAALEKITGSFEQALRAASEILAIEGKVIPSTLADTHLCAVLKDGTIIREEYNVRAENKAPIEHVYLEPEDAAATEEAIQEISQADTIVIGPGSLYTSVITNLLVRGITRAIRGSDARVIYVCNIVTQPGQTDGYTAADHVRAVQRYLGEGAPDYAIVNNATPPKEVLQRYQAAGAQLLHADDDLRALGPQIIEADIVENVDQDRVLWEKQDLLRHDPAKLAHIIMELR
jgi:uncharacterized cofD-like protein